MFLPILRTRLSTVSALFSLAIAGLLPSVAQAADPAPRNWSQNPAIVETDWPIIMVWAIGDTHGDYGRLIDLLVKGGIIDEVSRQPDQLANVKWKAGNAVLVCTGDMIDKGTQSIEVLQFFMRLQKIAPEGGGQVIVTMGNHEAEFLANPTKKNKEFVDELKQRNIDVSAVQNGTDSLGLGQFMRSLPFAARVHSWFFAHAGNTNSNNMPDAARHPRSLEDLRLFLETDVTSNGYGGQSLSNSDSLLEARLDDPWWEKKPESRQDSENRLRKYVFALSPQVQHLVVGHKPGNVKFNGDATRPRGVMATRCAGLLFLIDCGMTSAAEVNYSTGALLRIRPDDAYSIRFDGNVRKEELLWSRVSPSPTP